MNLTSSSSVSADSSPPGVSRLDPRTGSSEGEIIPASERGTGGVDLRCHLPNARVLKSRGDFAASCLRRGLLLVVVFAFSVLAGLGYR